MPDENVGLKPGQHSDGTNSSINIDVTAISVSNHAGTSTATTRTGQLTCRDFLLTCHLVGWRRSQAASHLAVIMEQRSA